MLATRFTGIAPAPADDATYHASPAIAYDLGNLAARSGNLGVLVTPVKGWVRYPLAKTTITNSDTTRFPVVVLLHGQHTSSSPSFQGYDYLAHDLATHGYVALSIDANAINSVGDTSSQSRAQLVLGTLDRLRAINANGGPGMLNQLQGKLDLSRVGIMGHSRGGQGISYTLKYNLTRVGVTKGDLQTALLTNPNNFADYPDLVSSVSGTSIDAAKFSAAVQKYNLYYAASAESVAPYTFRAAFMLAPTDFNGNLGLIGVPLAVLLPSCDGDMSDLEGARTFDHNRFSFDTDTASRYQVFVKGANHNFYNTVWTKDGDDNADTGENDYCAYRSNSPRLNAQDQQRGGLFLINSFMRLQVGGEQQFAAYWNGHAQLPDSACPNGKGPCDARVVMTTQRDAANRILIQRFEQRNSLAQNLLGGALAFSGFDGLARCSMPFGDHNAVGDCTPNRLDGFEYRGFSSGPDSASHGLLSIADHLEAAWSASGAAIATDLKGVSTKGYDSLTFRLAIVRPMGQEVVVTLTDTAGKSASVNASDFSDALYLGPQQKRGGRPLVDAIEDKPFEDGAAPQLLNMVAIPLAAFPNIDTAHVAQVNLRFPKDSGAIALADLEFQNLERN
ncbi:hypothetical protein [Burkholderia ambifaria]|uniref:poly(ethylene terephthalate) hydrolase family protein n=1 Tax=Burkholderia ambifaria TaxID=152480 RepID=UPI00158D1D59|nr:hypothetical protein [Burkholderia ambifaria]